MIVAMLSLPQVGQVAGFVEDDSFINASTFTSAQGWRSSQEPVHLDIL
jgi:hypothetical protein